MQTLSHALCPCNACLLKRPMGHKVDENLFAKRKDWRPIYNPLRPLCIHLSLCILLATQEERGAPPFKGATNSEVARTAKVLPLQSEFLPEHSTGDTFGLGSDLRQGCGRRVFDQEVAVVRFSVELQQLEAALLGATDTERSAWVSSACPPGFSCGTWSRRPGGHPAVTRCDALFSELTRP